MLAPSKTIRALSRALPALVPSAPDLSVPVPAELLDAHTQGLGRHYDEIFPVIERAGHTLAEAIERLDAEEIPDPDGEGAAALEQAEVHFKCRKELLRLSRDPLTDAGASPSHSREALLHVLDRVAGVSL